jgi:hypothetical protein
VVENAAAIERTGVFCGQQLPDILNSIYLFLSLSELCAEKEPGDGAEHNQPESRERACQTKSPLPKLLSRVAVCRPRARHRARPRRQSTLDFLASLSLNNYVSHLPP